MSQPEMRPDRSRGAGRGRPGDLLGRRFPPGDWREPTERLDELYEWAEQNALRTVEWYLGDRRGKRRVARWLRWGTAVGLLGGAALPLLDLTGAVDAAAGWGSLSLLAAAMCGCCDRYFGFTSGWMRDVATAQAVQRRIETLRYDWAAENVRGALGPAETAAEGAERCLALLRRFSEDVTDLVRAETADWMTEFGSGAAPLRTQLSASGAARTECCPPQRGRMPVAPTTRAAMPRQRPPEGPR